MLQPVFLLYTKLLAWAKSDLSTRKEKNDLNEVNMEDVITILNWLQRKRILIEMHGWSKKTRERYLWLLGFVYRREYDTRGLIAQRTHTDDLHEAFGLSNKKGYEEFLFRWFFLWWVDFSSVSFFFSISGEILVWINELNWTCVMATASNFSQYSSPSAYVNTSAIS